MTTETIPGVDVDALKAKLRARKDSGVRTGGGWIDAAGNGGFYQNKPVMFAVNPDGDAAARAIDALIAKIEADAAEIERLQRVIDSRPAINAGLPDSYIKWSQSIMMLEVNRALGNV